MDWLFYEGNKNLNITSEEKSESNGFGKVPEPVLY